MDRCEKRLLNGLIIRSRRITRRGSILGIEDAPHRDRFAHRARRSSRCTVIRNIGIRLSVAATYGLSARLCGKKVVHIISHSPYVGHVCVFHHMVEG